MTELVLQKPQGVMTQPFGVNYNSSYKEMGLKGHPGIDYFFGYRKPIVAAVDGKVSAIRKAYNPNVYSAVYQIIDLEKVSYEVSYGHLCEIYVKEGDYVKKGQIIGLEGNFGLSYSNGVLVSKEEKATGKGSHLHFQARLCQLVKERDKKKTYLRNSKGYITKYRKYYEVIDYDNGFNGCIDPAIFFPKESNSLLKFLNLFKRK